MNSVSFSSLAHSGNIDFPEKEKAIVALATKEAFKRLHLRYPGRSICKEKITFYKIKHTQNEPNIELSYDGKTYHLRMKHNHAFESDDLKIKIQYPEKVLEIALHKLSGEVGKSIQTKEIAVDFFDEIKGYQFSLVECENNFNKYINQKNEIHYSFDILFQNHKHSYCFNEKGEARQNEKF